MGRWAAIDFGTRRIGLALADPRGLIASPAETLQSSGNASAAAHQIIAWADQNEVDAFVVGLPLNMDGTDSDQTRLTRAFAADLAKFSDRPVELWDERLSSFRADELLAASDFSRARRRARRDALAAQVILQSFLDARRASDGDATPPGCHCS